MAAVAVAVAARSPLLLLLLAACLACASAEMEGVNIVGDKNGWVPNFNYSEWANTTHIYPGDWIGFRFDRNMFDVAMVNKTAYETCDTSHLLWQYNKSVAYLQLNKTGRYYFICTRGYCFSQMKVSVLVEPRPSPVHSPAAKEKSGAASGAMLARVAVAVAAVCSVFFRL